MQIRWKLLIALSLVVVVLTLATGRVARADPSNNPNVFAVTYQCGTEAVTFIGVVSSAVFLDVNSNRNFIVTRVDFTPVGGTDTETLFFAPGHGRARGIQGDLVTCTTRFLWFDGVTYDFVLTGFFTPR